MASGRARLLRQSPTHAEQQLWSALRRRQLEGLHFRRQVPIGPYVVDFACFAKRLLVELDGGQHAREADRDAVRTSWLESRGFRVLRFWNNDALANTEGVVETIRRAAAE